MIKDAWLPIDYPIVPGLTAGTVKFDGDEFQIIFTKGSADAALLASPALTDYWVGMGLLLSDTIERVRFGSQSFSLLTSDERVLAPVSSCRPADETEMLAFASAIRLTRARGVTVSLSGGIYFERLALLLPVMDNENAGDDMVLGQYVTGGVNVSISSVRRVLALVPWLDASSLERISNEAGFAAVSTGCEIEVPSGKPSFELAGRPELTNFFREHVIDIVENPDRYGPLGIDFPSAIVLHGPPGCGKTYAIERLVEYLDWPCFTVDSSSIGSPFIHETGRKISEVFSNALKNAPSIVVIDEMEAFLADRSLGSSSSTHRVEEVAEFLRKIPEAAKNHVLVVGMTNRIEMIDPAILRRGRFDQLIEVPMATEEEISQLLTHLLSDRPCGDDVNISSVAQSLGGRPLSDVSFLVREASRLAAKSGKGKVDGQVLAAALKALGRRPSGETHQKIGF